MSDARLRRPAASIVLIAALVPAIAGGTRRRPPIDMSRERARVLAAADGYLSQAPITVTASHSTRSAGGLHDYFSEGDYWWPDPKNPDGPYIQKDGLSNPANFD